MSKRFYFFIGTNAEFIKLAPVMKELKSKNIHFKIILSGQNRINFGELVDYCGILNANIMLPEKSNRSSVVRFFIWALRTLFTACIILNHEFKGLNKNNSYFIVHGDTVSALIGSIVAIRYNLRLVHIESGLYSHNFLEPFPEEFCRKIIDRISNILFISNKWARENVKNLSGKKVEHYQNTLIESFSWSLGVKPKTDFVKNISKLSNYYIIILHRQEHVIFRKGWSKNILELILKYADQNLNCIVLKHPLTIKLIEELISKQGTRVTSKLTAIDPLPYSDFMKLFKNAEFIATDGCINQLESYYMGIPCLALRSITEQPEGIDKNVVICKGNKDLVKKFLKDYKKYQSKPVIPTKKPSKIIVDYLLNN